uniref:F-box domain-containing protein n=1 Tax=Fagus sylvatica TaxID=28930 RepID=A0A2N9H529_FAGSY
MSDSLPDEVVLEILHRLPAKSLIRLRCVSKLWNSRITSPAFITSHLTQSLSHSNSNTKIVRYRTIYPPVEHYKLFRDENDSFHQIQQLQLPVTSRLHHHFKLIGYVNGLFCLYKQGRFIVWNPSIKKSITFPKPSIAVYGRVTFRIAFGFDPRSNDYKVVRIAIPFEEEKPPLVEVYSLNEGSWRITSAGTSLTKGISFNGWLQPAASLNGAVHFAATDMDNANSSFVLSFDLGDEVFRIISVPNGIFGDVVQTLVHRGSLSLLCNHNNEFRTNKFCSVWVMKEYGVVDSWTKQFTVDFNGGMVRVLGLRKNGHILVEARVRSGWELSSYDPESQQVNNIGIHGMAYDFHIDNYMESLVMLDKPNDAVSRREVSRKRKCR